MAINNLKDSRVEISEVRNAVQMALFVNSLREERVYLHYLRGNIGTPNSQCGTRQSKLKKAGRQWVDTGNKCDNGAPIFMIT